MEINEDIKNTDNTETHTTSDIQSDASAESLSEAPLSASAESPSEVLSDASAEPSSEVLSDASAESLSEAPLSASAESSSEAPSGASAENGNAFNSFEKVYKIHDNDHYHHHTRNSGGNDRRGEFFKDRDPAARTNKFRKFDKIEFRKLVIDYKKPEILQEFLTEKGRILSRLITGNSAQNQRRLTREVKRARYIGFLPNA